MIVSLLRILFFLIFIGFTLPVLSSDGVYFNPEEIRRLNPRETNTILNTEVRLLQYPNKKVILKDVLKTSALNILVPIYFTCNHVCPQVIHNVRNFVMKNKSLLQKYKISIWLIDIRFEETKCISKQKCSPYGPTTLPDAIVHGIKKYQLKPILQSGLVKILYGLPSELIPFFQSAGLFFDQHATVTSHVPAQVFIQSNGQVSRYLYGNFSSQLDIVSAISETYPTDQKPLLLNLLSYFTYFDNSQHIYRVHLWKLAILLSLPIFTMMIFLRLRM